MGYLHSSKFREFSYYLENMSIGLDDWPINQSISILPYYSKSALFILYIYERHGIGLVKDIFLNSRNQAIDGIINQMGGLSNFSLEFKDFIISIISNSFTLIELENIRIKEFENLKSYNPTPECGFSIKPIQVPHRAELSDMHAFLIQGPQNNLLFLPDHDSWETGL